MSQHNPTRKASNTLKPLAVTGALGTGSPNTPRLNARKAAKQRDEAKAKKTSVVDEIKALPADSEGRQVYARAAQQEGGAAATAAFLEWKRQQTV